MLFLSTFSGTCAVVAIYAVIRSCERRFYQDALRLRPEMAEHLPSDGRWVFVKGLGFSYWRGEKWASDREVSRLCFVWLRRLILLCLVTGIGINVITQQIVGLVGSFFRAG